MNFLQLVQYVIDLLNLQAHVVESFFQIAYLLVLLVDWFIDVGDIFRVGITLILEGISFLGQEINFFHNVVQRFVAEVDVVILIVLLGFVIWLVFIEIVSLVIKSVFEVFNFLVQVFRVFFHVFHLFQQVFDVFGVLLSLVIQMVDGLLLKILIFWKIFVTYICVIIRRWERRWVLHSVYKLFQVLDLFIYVGHLFLQIFRVFLDIGCCFLEVFGIFLKTQYVICVVICETFIFGHAIFQQFNFLKKIIQWIIILCVVLLTVGMIWVNGCFTIVFRFTIGLRIVISFIIGLLFVIVVVVISVIDLFPKLIKHLFESG